MSSILEALRKSEAERTAGSSASVLPVRDIYQTRKGGRRLTVVVVLAAVVGTLTIAGWRYTRHSGVDADRPLSQTTKVPTSDPTPQANVSPATAQMTAAAAPAPNVANPGAPTDPATEEVPQPLAQQLAQPKGVETYEALSDEPPLRPVTVLTQPNAPEEKPRAGPAIVVAPLTSRAERSAAFTAGRNAAPAPPAEAPPAPGSRLPTLGQLPRLREQIGTLDMSMLVFNSDPARRFALINGQRMKQGDELGDGIKLLEIRRNECVFAANGQQFVLRNQ